MELGSAIGGDGDREGAAGRPVSGSIATAGGTKASRLLVGKLLRLFNVLLDLLLPSLGSLSSFLVSLVAFSFVSRADLTVGVEGVLLFDFLLTDALVSRSFFNGSNTVFVLEVDAFCSDVALIDIAGGLAEADVG